MFTKIIFFCALAVACISAKPLVTYSAPLVASPSLAYASPYAVAYSAPQTAGYTAAAPLTAAYTAAYPAAYPAAYSAAYTGLPYAAYSSVVL